MKASRKRSAFSVSAALLYVALVMLSTMAVAAADWADHVAFIPLIGLAGALTGLALSYSLFTGRMSALIAAAYGLFITGGLFGGALDPAFDWHERVIILFGRLRVFLSVVGGGLENQDPMIVVLLMALLYWALAVYGAWSYFRRRGLWGAVVPLGLALFINAFYYIGEARLDALLAAYVLVSLLIFLLFEFDQRQQLWHQLRTRVPANTFSNVVRIGVIFVLVLVGLSWVGPAFAGSEPAAHAWSVVSRPWQAARERLGNAVASLRSPVLLVGDQFSDSLTLQAGTEPSDALVMEVAPSSNLTGSGRFYWRARTFDHYEGGEWDYLGSAELRFDPREGELLLPDSKAREIVEVTIALHNAVQRILYVPAQPIWTSRTSDLEVHRQDGQVVDVTAFLSAQPIFRGEAYRARGSIAVPQADELRSAGEAYPGWVTERYLQVPDEITGRTRELTRRIADGLPTAYDKAATITAWLRSNIGYQRVTAAPPADQEAIDWFLFDYQTGFCNYYASAEVIMLRTLGVPARLAIGYARGEFMADRGVYEVRAADYHAWPEVYFPGYGWVEFEPTVSQSPLLRPEPPPDPGEPDSALRSGFGSRGELDELRLDRMEDLLTQEPAAAGSLQAPPATRIFWARLAMLLLVVLTAAAYVWTRLDVGWRLSLGRVLERWTTGIGWTPAAERLIRWSGPTTPARRSYIRWLGWWPRLGLQPSPDQTPAERADLFGDAFPAMAAAGRHIAANYAAERFGHETIPMESVRSTWKEILGQLWKAWLARWQTRLRRWIQEPSS
jgi:transglutaminase-like putative cysteine protease